MTSSRAFSCSLLALGLFSAFGGATDREACERHSDAGRWTAALRVCEAAYRDGRRDADAGRLAYAYEHNDRHADAVALARAVEGGMYSNYLLADLLMADAPTLALLHASLSMADALARGRVDWIGRAAHLHAGAAKAIGKLALADASLDLAEQYSLEPDYARFGRVNLLRYAGDYEEAGRLGQEVVKTAAPAARAESAIQLGLVYSESERYGLAKDQLLDAIRHAANATQISTAALNLAFIESEQQACPVAFVYLQLAGMNESEGFDWMLSATRIALRCGETERAVRWLAEARALGHERRWSWQVFDLAGTVAARRGDLDTAQREYMAAITEVEQLRRDGGRLEAIVAGKLVEPYEHAIALAVARGDARAALDLVLRYEQRHDAGASIDATLEAWRERTLVVLIRAGDHVLRLVVADGAVTGADLGVVPRVGALDLLTDDDPGARAVARTLGEALPRAVEVHVNLVGDLASVPLAALRRGAVRVIEDTALVRAVRITPDPRPRAAGSAMIVLGDPAGDLAGARSEATWVAGALAVTPRLGTGADRRALVDARDAAVLHVAAHAEWTLDGPQLPLADGIVTDGDLRALTPAPRLVVLASCFSARARDRSGWTSLASRFIDAGAGLVISTQTSVDDAAARRLVESFYRHGGVTAPAEALRQAQLELAAAGVDAHEWASFVAIAAPPTTKR